MLYSVMENDEQITNLFIKVNKRKLGVHHYV